MATLSVYRTYGSSRDATSVIPMTPELEIIVICTVRLVTNYAFLNPFSNEISSAHGVWTARLKLYFVQKGFLK